MGGRSPPPTSPIFRPPVVIASRHLAAWQPRGPSITTSPPPPRIINALPKTHYQTGTIRAQFRDNPHPSSENRRLQTAKPGETARGSRSGQPHATTGSTTRRTEATAPVTTRRRATARTRTGRNPTTTARVRTAASATTNPSARNRCTIAQSTAINPSNAQKIRQIETTRSQQPISSAKPTTSPTAPRSAHRLKEGEAAAERFIPHSKPRHLAEQKSKDQH